MTKPQGKLGHSRVREKTVTTRDKSRFQAPRGILEVTLHRYLRCNPRFRVSVIGDDDMMLEMEGDLNTCQALYDKIVDDANWDELVSWGMTQG